MKKFLGLLTQEHRHHEMFYYVMAGLAGIVEFLGPVLIVQVFPNVDYYDIPETRLTMSMLVAALLWLLSIAMFTSSLNGCIKTKELWLHNSQSIYALIGAKVVYHGIVLIVLNIIPFIGLVFVGDLTVGTFMQYVVFGFVCLFIFIMIYILFIVGVLFLNALNTQVERYIGKLSYVVMFVSAILLLELIERMPTFTFLQVGKVQLANFNDYLPSIQNDPMNLTLFIDFYIVEEIVMTAIVILIYMLSCKWIERVITR